MNHCHKFREKVQDLAGKGVFLVKNGHERGAVREPLPAASRDVGGIHGAIRLINSRGFSAVGTRPEDRNPSIH